jgi:hypothetical protein
VIIYAVVDDALSPGFPLGDSLEVFIRREDAERFIEEVRGDDPDVAAKLRIEERELEAGGDVVPAGLTIKPRLVAQARGARWRGGWRIVPPQIRHLPVRI